MWRAVLLGLAACSFQHGAASAGQLPTDAASGADSRATPDTSGPGIDACPQHFLDLCAVPAPTTPVDISGADTIDTDHDPRCVTVAQNTGSPVCLVNATEVSIGLGASLTAFGSRPLAIRSTSTLEVSGAIDVGSTRGGTTGPAADDASCSFAATPGDSLGGAGGGAGGSFAGAGGSGGTGNTDMSAGSGMAPAGTPGPATTTFAYLRGGCPGQTGGNEQPGGGQGGTGAAGGGALYLVADGTIAIDGSGSIRAAGAGGSGGQTQSGGGGGGSGGLVVIESSSITIDGQVSANGGGGGEGGGRAIYPNGTYTDYTGNPGDDGTFGTTGASGGSGVWNVLGPGGNGAAGTTGDGTQGTSSVVGAGGGGGAAGAIVLIGTHAVTGTVSPPPM